MVQAVLDRPRQQARPLAQLWRGLRRWWEIRRSVRSLKALDNRMLRDIGVDRYDIEAVVRANVDRLL